MFFLTIKMPFTCVVSCCNSKQKKRKKEEKNTANKDKKLHFTDDVFRYLQTATITTTRAYNYHKHA